MLNKFQPKYIFDNIYDITPEFLKSIDKTAIILDIDDTLVPHGQRDIPNSVYEWIISMKKEKIEICVLSNNNAARVNDTLGKLNLNGVCSAKKPSKRGYSKASVIMDKNEDECVSIGDQIYTDIWGANKAGVTSILVHPVSRYSHWFFALKRWLEKPILKKGAVIKSYEKE